MSRYTDSARARARRLIVPLVAAALALAAGRAAAIPDIQHWKTDHGVQVLFVETHELPIADVQVVFDAASSRDGGKPGVAHLTNDLLNEGAGKLSVEQIAERFDEVGAQYNSNALRDMALVSVRTLTDPKLMEPAIETLALVLQDPTFPKDALERERKRMLVALQEEEQSPGALATRRFYSELYGGHPYATEPLGTAPSLRSLTRGDVVGFYHRYYVTTNALVVIVGDLDRQKAADIANTLTGKLAEGRAPQPLPTPKPLQASRTVDVPYDSSQTHVLSGQIGIARQSPDYFPLYVGNHVLGGNGLVSLMAEEVREKRGLSYSTYTYFQPMQAKGPFIMGLQTRNNKVQEAIKVMDQTLKDFVKDGPSQKRLKEAKENITGGFPLQIDSNSKIAGYLAMIGFYNLPLDYLKTYNDKVERVGLEDIRRAFDQHVDPARLLTVIVGGGAKNAAQQ